MGEKRAIFILFYFVFFGRVDVVCIIGFGNVLFLLHNTPSL